MRLLIITTGSLGDVAPYTGLAARLQAAGHDVDIATHRRFAPIVRQCGIGFRRLRGDLSALDDSGAGGEGDDADEEVLVFEPGLRALAGNVARAAAFTRAFARHLAAAVEDGGADVLLLGHPVAPLGWHVADAFGIPSVGTYIVLPHAARSAPPPGRLESLPPRARRAVLATMELALDGWLWRPTRELRRELGLPPMRPGALRRRLEAERWPICLGVSPTVLPRPDGWRDGLEVVGYWWSQYPQGWTPTPELVDFLDAGPPPVLVCLGSFAASHPQIGEAIRPALRRAGVRAIVQDGTAGLDAGTGGGGLDAGDGPDVLTIAGAVSYDWLMPRTAAVVHHAGAGTTGAAVRAGVPSVVVPHAFDQPFWAGRLDALGVGPGTLPAKGLTPDRLARAIRAAVSDPAYRLRARAVAERVAAEDGAGRVLEVVERIGAGRPA